MNADQVDDYFLNLMNRGKVTLLDAPTLSAIANAYRVAERIIGDLDPGALDSCTLSLYLKLKEMIPGFPKIDSQPLLFKDET